MSFAKCCSPKTGEYCGQCYSSKCATKNCNVADTLLCCATCGQSGNEAQKAQQNCNDCNNTLTCCNNGCQTCQTCENNSNSTGFFRISSIFKFLPLFNSLGIVFSSSILLGFLESFNSKGPIYMTIFGAIFLGILLSGARITFSSSSCQRTKAEENPELITRLWKLTFFHSHHPQSLRNQNHEFRIGSKYFCTGCYGIFLGTLISIVIGLLYIQNSLSIINLNLLIFLIPLCFLPIIIKYTVIPNMKTPLRLLSNVLLPIGFSLTLIFTDFVYQSWIINTIIVLLVVLGAYLRGIISVKENNISSVKINLATNPEIKEMIGDTA